MDCYEMDCHGMFRRFQDIFLDNVYYIVYSSYITFILLTILRNIKKLFSWYSETPENNEKILKYIETLLTLAMSNFRISTKYFGMQIRMVYNPQSTLKLAIITAHTGREVIMESHGTFSFCKEKRAEYFQHVFLSSFDPNHGPINVQNYEDKTSGKEEGNSYCG